MPGTMTVPNISYRDFLSKDELREHDLCEQLADVELRLRVLEMERSKLRWQLDQLRPSQWSSRPEEQES